MEATLVVPNAIIFVVDPQRTGITVPEYDPSEVVASSGSCIAIKTLSEVDGEVTVHLERPSDKSTRGELKNVFSGALETPSRSLAVVTSSMRRVLQTVVEDIATMVSVDVDDYDAPATIVVRLET